jgi:YVTN family beta-propeller protein
MDYRLLGPLEVRENGRPVPLGGPKQRAVLALLVLNANRVVSRDALIDRLWESDPPPTAATALHGYVSGLRKALGPELIATRSPGYLLMAEPEQIDLGRFEALRASARDRSEPQAAARELRSALELWRGEALEDIRLEPAVQAEAARLDDLRLAVVEDRIDADLAAGEDPGELVAELERLVASQPLRERFWGQLMLALYRSGRQADALDAYRRARHHLISQLGIEPGQSVRDLHQRILEQDPGLDAPRRAARVGSRRRWPLIAASAAGLIAVTAAILVAILGSDETSAVSPNSMAIVDPEDGELVGAIELDSRPGPVAAGAGSVWALSLDSHTLYRVDPRSRTLVRTAGIGGDTGTLAASAGEVWVADGCASGGIPGGVRHLFTTRDGGTDLDGDPISLADAHSTQPPGVQDLAAPRCGLAASGTSAWVVTNLQPGVARVDFDRGSGATGIATAMRLPRSPAALAVGAGALWAADSDEGVVLRLDPDSLRLLKSVRVGNEPVAIAATGTAIWAVNRQDGTLTRIDARTGSVTKAISVGELPVAVAVGAGSVWVANSGDRTLSRIDPATNRVVKEIALGRAPRGVAVAAGRVWVSVGS